METTTTGGSPRRRLGRPPSGAELARTNPFAVYDGDRTRLELLRKRLDFDSLSQALREAIRFAFEESDQ